MDLDGPQNDKGLYALAADCAADVDPQRGCASRGIRTGRARGTKAAGADRVGFLSQVSPDGQYVVTTLNPEALRGQFQGLPFPPGVLSDARDPGLVQPGDRPQTAPAGGRRPALRADRRRLEPRRQVPGLCSGGSQGRLSRRAGKWPSTPTIPTRTPIQYDLYRIPFNGGQRRPAGADRRRLAERHEQHLPQGLARRPLDRLRAMPQRPVDASRQPALHRSGRRRPGAADAMQHAADELLAQFFAQRPLAGLLLEEPLALHADVSDAPGRGGQRQPGDPDRECHGGQSRGEHSRVREHPAGRLC